MSTSFRIRNGQRMGNLDLTNEVHLIYAGCPSCGADLETRESTKDEEAWRWLKWYCPACAEYKDEAHLATFPMLDFARGRIRSVLETKVIKHGDERPLDDMTKEDLERLKDGIGWHERKLEEDTGMKIQRRHPE